MAIGEREAQEREVTQRTRDMLQKAHETSLQHHRSDARSVTLQGQTMFLLWERSYDYEYAGNRFKTSPARLWLCYEASPDNTIEVDFANPENLRNIEIAIGTLNRSDNSERRIRCPERNGGTAYRLSVTMIVNLLPSHGGDPEAFSAEFSVDVGEYLEYQDSVYDVERGRNFTDTWDAEDNVSNGANETSAADESNLTNGDRIID